MTDGASNPIIAAGISGAVAFLAAIFTKETKTSEFRQSWIDGVRSDVSEFLAHASSLAFFIDSKKQYNVKEGDIVQDLYEKDEKLIAFQTCRRRIILRLNPKEHASLAAKINLLGNTRLLDLTGQHVECLALDITRLCAEILKSEWKRVKRGEWIFVFAKYTSLALALCLAGYFLWSIVRSVAP